jgi:HD-like signal output (HDOD) protein
MSTSGKRRILFVDDDPHLLAGLKRILRSRRNEWQISFAQSGVEALTSLSAMPVDVILTDFRMAGMNGLELLKEVKARHPQVVRIFFSGEVDQGLIMESVRVAHQFISKPCNAEALKDKIEQTISLRHVLEDEALRAVVSEIDSLPSLPTMYNEIMVELASPSASIKKIGHIIAGDIAMTSKILQLVNSAFFGLRRKVTSPDQAVLLLGLDIVKALVLSLQIFSQFNMPKVFFPMVSGLWQHSLSTGNLAKQIAATEHLSKEIEDQSFMAGLLHDCGKLVLLANFPEQMQTVLTESRDTETSELALEKRVFGVTHASVGAYLLGLWGLPTAITSSISYHHSPGESPEKTFSVLTAVHVANHLDHGPNPPPDEPVATDTLDMTYLTEVGGMEKWSVWKEFANT